MADEATRVMADETALHLRRISKQYEGVTVLRDIELEIAAGQVHALLGGNGAGKSTVVKIMSGVIPPDPGGSMSLWGKQISLPVSKAYENGLAVIHQDLGLLDNMTVLENMGVSSHYGARILGRISMRSERRLCEELLAEMHLDVSPDQLVSTLSPAVRAGIAIARARRVMREYSDKYLFVLDEPTAYLDARESEAVMRLMRKVADSGCAVMFISHHLKEVMDTADHISVLRDGRVADSFPAGAGDKNRIITAMLGRELVEPYPEVRPIAGGATRLDVRGLSGQVVRDVSFEVRAGEILGFAGLVGMGHEELPYLVAGSGAATQGTISVDGTDISSMSIRERVSAGIALVPGNRQRDGVWPDGTAEENVVLTATVAGRRKSLNRRGERRSAATLLARFGVKPPDPARLAIQYSGGNQQKIVLAKWLSMGPRIVVLDEPTQGVDVGAKFDVLSEIAATAAAGGAVLMSSGDYEQLAAMCHRVLVLRHGRVVAELHGRSLSETTIAAAVHG
ncbi:sugar ABC transporter ATP-binding protein [Nonomuraea lactucae]|uniref:sugar ABC transporter ATP-binding protein n=1 Tax=Nonomuraea lactucae TaxID=2249762 RepID=UPI000DE20B6A|nr:sugar ABC transporter ATP-binding protein [Nonomuraea lactucae]